VDAIQTETVKKDRAWSLNRIPTTTYYDVRVTPAPPVRNEVSLVSVSNITMDDGSVTCSRSRPSRGWQGTIKL